MVNNIAVLAPATLGELVEFLANLYEIHPETLDLAEVFERSSDGEIDFSDFVYSLFPFIARCSCYFYYHKIAFVFSLLAQWRPEFLEEEVDHDWPNQSK